MAGGMRSLTWSSAAKAIAALLALAVPATHRRHHDLQPAAAADDARQRPAPARAHRSSRGVPTSLRRLRWAFDLPGEGLSRSTKRFLQAFGSVGALAFVLIDVHGDGGHRRLALAARPLGTTPGVYEARKSLGWAVLVAGLVVLTLPAVGRLPALLAGRSGRRPAGRPPAATGSERCSRLGIAQVDGHAHDASASRNISFERDAALFALPIAAACRRSLVYLSLAGALAAALARWPPAWRTLGAILSEDVVVHGLPRSRPRQRAASARARVALPAPPSAASLAIASPGRSAAAVPVGPHASGVAALFPVLVLSIWWKRINAWGAIAGMLAGWLRDRRRVLAICRIPAYRAIGVAIAAPSWRCRPPLLHHRRQPADAGAGPACARNGARHARARRRDAL